MGGAEERLSRRAREQELRERADKQRKAAETEADEVEKKRKQTRARKAEEEADRLAAANDDPDVEGDDEGAGSDLPSHRVPTTPESKPKPKAQLNFTDPDSRIMKRGGSYLQGINCQIVVDEGNQIIVAEAVTNQSPDQEHLTPMMERVQLNTGRSPNRLSADTGYMSEDNVEYCEAHGIDAYIAVGRERHDKADEDDACQHDSEVWRAMQEKLTTEEGRAIYARRKVIVEPVFGHGGRRRSRKSWW